VRLGAAADDGASGRGRVGDEVGEDGADDALVRSEVEQAADVAIAPHVGVPADRRIAAPHQPRRQGPAQRLDPAERRGELVLVPVDGDADALSDRRQRRRDRCGVGVLAGEAGRGPGRLVAGDPGAGGVGGEGADRHQRSTDFAAANPCGCDPADPSQWTEDDHEVGGTPDDWFQRVHPEDSAALARDIESARSGQATTFACRHRLRHKDGAYRWMLCRGTVLRNKAGQAIRLTGSHSDVTVEMVTDSLTGLPNRLLLMDRLTHSIERAHRHKGFHFAVLVIDLGRPATGVSRAAKPVSDPIVTAVARRLETCLRIPDTMPSLRHNDLVARVNVDRFAILLDGLKEISHAKIVGERILREILRPFALGGREISL